MSVLIRPVKTEKSMKNAQSNSFTFIVSTMATKYQIRQAVKDNFDVDATEVRTLNTMGKTRRMKKNLRLLPDLKKAIITLKEGQTISLFEVEKKGKGKRVTVENKK